MPRNSLVMSSAWNNSLIAGLSVALTFCAFAFVKVERDRQEAARVYQLDLSTILQQRSNYGSREVAVVGFLSWHPDEPVLFADEQALRDFDFEQSIPLVLAGPVGIGFANRQAVVVTGTLVFTMEDSQRFVDYQGYIVAESLKLATAAVGQ